MAYLQAGAQEVWIVSEDGAWHIVGVDGPRAVSAFGCLCPSALSLAIGVTVSLGEASSPGT